MVTSTIMLWTVKVSRRAEKQIRHLPTKVVDSLHYLVKEIRFHGPTRGNWPNYGKLPGRKHHCHLTKGRTTYVAVWEVTNRKTGIVEVIYVGSHEGAPY